MTVRYRSRILVAVVSGLAALSVGAKADDLTLSALTPGSYLPKDLACDQIGGASSTYFDGRSFSEHYQYCVTQADHGVIGHYRQTCIEHQGPNPPTEADILKSPDRSSFTLELQVLSPTTFKLRGRNYRLCP